MDGGKDTTMCGRYTLSTPVSELAQLFDVAEKAALPPRYNIAPSQPVLAVRVPTPGSHRELSILQWGFVPAWAKEAAIGNRMINARSETAATSPAFRSAFRRRRCLIPADGFFEWQKTNGRKQPFLIRRRDGRPFAFGGLWEIWEGREGEVIESCTILTTQPNDVVRPVHDRMPVIVEAEAYDLWLDPGVQQPERIEALLGPYSAMEMEAVPVGTLVNNPTNDIPDCIAPLVV
jgi:putative SOS response-associated peptidase YedK